jgi:hypothetical protein
MKKTYYELNYTYYQYNTGMADNGTYNRTKTYTDYNQALKYYKAILKEIGNDGDVGEHEELENEFLPNAGYFINAKLTKSIRENIVLDENGNESIEE